MTAKSAQDPGLAEFATPAVGVLRIVDLRIQRGPGPLLFKASEMLNYAQHARHRPDQPDTG